MTLICANMLCPYQCQSIKKIRASLESSQTDGQTNGQSFSNIPPWSSFAGSIKMKFLIDTDAQYSWLYSARLRVQIGAIYVILLDIIIIAKIEKRWTHLLVGAPNTTVFQFYSGLGSLFLSPRLYLLLLNDKVKWW